MPSTRLRQSRDACETSDGGARKLVAASKANVALIDIEIGGTDNRLRLFERLSMHGRRLARKLWQRYKRNPVPLKLTQ